MNNFKLKRPQCILVAGLNQVCFLTLFYIHTNP